MNLYAVIPSNNRPGLLRELVDTLIEDAVSVVIIDTGYEPPLPSWHHRITVLRDAAQEPNISRWWNLGLDYVKHLEGDEEHVVAVLNDDVVVPNNFVARLAVEIVSSGAAAAYPNQHGFIDNHLHRVAGPISIFRRMTGYAFALRGSANIRADEDLKWWFGDDDIDWKARQRGGSLLVSTLAVQHLYPNQTTVGALAEQAGRDKQTFIDKWGRAPW